MTTTATKKPKAKAKPKVAARPVGRPTVYRDEFVDMLIEFFSQAPTREVTNRDAKGNESTQTITAHPFLDGCGVYRIIEP